MITLQEVRTRCKGREILLIGNGPSSPASPGRFLLVRMNYGIMGGSATIWVNNISQPESVHEKLSQEASFDFIVRLNAEPRGDGQPRLHRRYPDHLHDQTFFWNTAEFVRMTEDLRITRPTTGLQSIYWFMTYVDARSIHMTGFDFFATPNVYTGTGATPVHTLQKEREYIHHLLATKRIFSL